MNQNNTAGHLSALLTIVIWGTTFISTKVLLTGFQPVEILFFRFVMGFLALWVVCPRPIRGSSLRRELVFAGAGLCGITLYYLMENIALTHTMAANVSVIVSVAPFFTALLDHLVTKGQERLRPHFFAGFAVAMAGIFLISFGGSRLQVSPAGDLMALAAALLWSCYAVLTKNIGRYGYTTVQSTRRIFAYGILFMIPALFLFDFRLDPGRFASPVYLFNILYLGLGASALCFVTWNYSVKILGPTRTSVYIYLVPVVTVLTSVPILHEQITPATGTGMALTLLGLLLSENPLVRRKR